MTIGQRLAKLEKQNRWMKRGGALMLACVACVVLMGQGMAKKLPDIEANTIRARKFVLVNDKGAERARLSMYRQRNLRPSPALVLYDDSHGARVILSVNLSNHGEPRPTLKLWGGKSRATGSVPAIMMVAFESSSMLVVASGTHGFEVKAANAADSSVGIYTDGKPIWKAPPK